MLKTGMIIAERYEIVGKIGTGGMADVYKAMDHKLNRFVAVKVLKPEFREDTTFIKKFRSEAQAAAGLTHPNIVNVFDVGDDGGVYYIVMELIEGITLKEYISKKGKLSIKEATSIAIQVSMGLEAAHSHGIVHRDVKPQNIIISTDGKVKVTDFGIARAASSNTISSNVMGSVHYSSPEQVRGGYSDEKSDIYSLGITLYEMVTGRVPFDGDNPVNIALMHINGEMVPPSKLVDGVPPALEHIILKCTDKYPVNRFASAEELIEALNNLEFVGSVVGNSVLMGGAAGQQNNAGNRGPIAETDYDDGEDDDQTDHKKNKDKTKKKKTDDAARKKKMIIIAAVAAAVLLGIIICFAAGVFGGKEIEAPNFKNMTLEQAQEAAADLDIKVKKGDEVVSEDVEKGLIVSQDPPKGTKIKTGSTIRVNISKGLGDGEVPDLIGKSQDELSSYLSAAGFALGSVDSAASDEPEGTVISQDPSAGSEA